VNRDLCRAHGTPTGRGTYYHQRHTSRYSLGRYIAYRIANISVNVLTAAAAILFAVGAVLCLLGVGA
jgi:hypothetical protein